MNNNSPDHFVNGLGLGLAVGTGVALLLATKRGEELRHKLARVINEVKSEIEDVAGDSSSIGSDQNVASALPRNSSLTPPSQPTLRGILESFYEVVKVELADLANTGTQKPQASAKKKKKPTTKFKNTKR